MIFFAILLSAFTYDTRKTVLLFTISTTYAGGIQINSRNVFLIKKHNNSLIVILPFSENTLELGPNTLKNEFF